MALPRCCMNRGNANDVIGRMDRAIEDYKKAIQIRPRHANAFYNLGIVYEKLGKIEMAFISYKKAASFGSKEAADKLNSWPQRR